jgi:hypothetical protein
MRLVAALANQGHLRLQSLTHSRAPTEESGAGNGVQGCATCPNRDVSTGSGRAF